MALLVVAVLRLKEAAVEFLWWVGWGGWGLQSHFHVQPNHCFEVVLRVVVVRVVTTNTAFTKLRNKVYNLS